MAIGTPSIILAPPLRSSPPWDSTFCKYHGNPSFILYHRDKCHPQRHTLRNSRFLRLPTENTFRYLPPPLSKLHLRRYVVFNRVAAPIGSHDRSRVPSLNVEVFIGRRAFAGEIYLVRAAARLSTVSLSCVPTIFIGSLSSLRSPLFPGSDLATKNAGRRSGIAQSGIEIAAARPNKFPRPRCRRPSPRPAENGRCGRLSRKGPQPSAYDRASRVADDRDLANEEIDSNRLLAYHRALAFTRARYPGMQRATAIYRSITSQQFTHVTRTWLRSPCSESMS